MRNAILTMTVLGLLGAFAIVQGTQTGGRPGTRSAVLSKSTSKLPALLPTVCKTFSGSEMGSIWGPKVNSVTPGQPPSYTFNASSTCNWTGTDTSLTFDNGASFHATCSSTAWGTGTTPKASLKRHWKDALKGMTTHLQDDSLPGSPASVRLGDSAEEYSFDNTSYWGTPAGSALLVFKRKYVVCMITSASTFSSGADQASALYLLAKRYVIAVNAFHVPPKPKG